MNAVSEIISGADKFFIGDEMLILNKNMHFMRDEKFKNLLSETAKSEHYKGMAYRLHLFVYAANLALSIKGDFVECGVFRGFKSFFLLSYLEDKLSDRSYFLFDTFEGIDTLQAVGSPVTKKEHEKSRLFEFVKHRFSKFDNVILIKGSVPDSLKKTRIKKVAFLHLDMNSYQAEIGALEHFWNKIPVGGVILLDDFGLCSHNAQMEFELPWLSERNQKILEFPTGQGLIIKK